MELATGSVQDLLIVSRFLVLAFYAVTHQITSIIIGFLSVDLIGVLHHFNVGKNIKAVFKHISSGLQFCAGLPAAPISMPEVLGLCDSVICHEKFFYFEL